MEAIETLRESAFYRDAFGDQFVNWLLGVKQSEVRRFLSAEPNWATDVDAVTAWEQREYFTNY